MARFHGVNLRAGDKAAVAAEGGTRTEGELGQLDRASEAPTVGVTGDFADSIRDERGVGGLGFHLSKVNHLG